MKLSVRLKTICDFVIPGNGVADVGADHGLVEKYLITNQISPYIIAIENKKGPFNILKNALIGYENIRVSLSDGISDIDEKVQTIILAGIGGINIVNILENNKQNLKNIEQIIVDAHRDIDLVKEKLNSLGFKIEKELEIIDAKKKYKIISFLRKD